MSLFDTKGPDYAMTVKSEITSQNVRNIQNEHVKMWGHSSWENHIKEIPVFEAFMGVKMYRPESHKLRRSSLAEIARPKILRGQPHLFKYLRKCGSSLRGQSPQMWTVNFPHIIAICVTSAPKSVEPQVANCDLCFMKIARNCSNAMLPNEDKPSP